LSEGCCATFATVKSKTAVRKSFNGVFVKGKTKENP
jgi:hypothetical protein